MFAQTYIELPIPPVKYKGMLASFFEIFFFPSCSFYISIPECSSKWKMICIIFVYLRHSFLHVKMQEKIDLPAILQTNYIYKSAIVKPRVRICLKKIKKKNDMIFREGRWLSRKSLLTDVT